MTEMEMDFMGRIGAWSMDNFKGIEDISTKQMVDIYWKEYFNTCTMSTPETGLEMPHENEYFSYINVWPYGFGESLAS